MPLIAAFAAAVALLSLVAFLGGLFWMFDLVAAFRPQLALVLLVLSSILMLSRWHRTALVIGLVMVVNVVTIIPLFVPGPRAATRDLRILSFNVLANNEDYEEVIEFIQTSGADLVVLHEASEPWEEALGEAGLGYTIWLNRNPEDIFSSVVLAPPDAVVESFGFRLDDPRSVAIRLPSGVSVLAIHPLSPQRRQRAELRDRQLAFAGDWVKEQAGPVIVTGDFNASPFSYPYRRLRATTGLNDSIRGFGLELTYPARLPSLLQVSIDHLLFSEGLAVVDRRLGPALGSDHFPLIVDLAVSS
ncbi:MAG: endonuclease/exonuclease/phosphatase family protein [Actinobacteria bacterium]|nr:endonuclease/exonuclease/phosphatase family protein [Actinomycetota bacterium]